MIRNIAPVKPWITRRPSGVWVGTRNTTGDVGNKLLLQQQTEKDIMPLVIIGMTAALILTSISVVIPVANAQEGASSGSSDFSSDRVPSLATLREPSWTLPQTQPLNLGNFAEQLRCDICENPPRIGPPGPIPPSMLPQPSIPSRNDIPGIQTPPPPG